MICSTIRKLAPISALLFVSLCLLPGAGRADVCSKGIAKPPFMAYGVDPNLLIIIDNSASMYDPGYVGTQGTCYDDGYASGTNYAGYFTRDTWYVYDFTDNWFESQTTSGIAKAVCTEANGTKYNNGAGTDDVCITINTGNDPDTVTAFAAKGNFLNWVTASKFDIEKKILTGGKWDSDNLKLVMESRGCGGRRFVKKLALDDGKYLTLAVKPVSSADHTTQIEIFQVNGTGFDNTYCQAALDEMAKDIPVLGTIKKEIDACMEYNHSPAQSYVAGEQPAFNQAIQTCWWEDKQGYWPEDGAQHVISLKNQCFNIYERIDPKDIATDSPGYVCYGKYGAAEGSAGYVGRCWEPAGGDRICTNRLCTTDGHIEGDTWKITGTDYKCEASIVKEYINKTKVWVIVQDCGGGGDISVDGWTNDQDVNDLDGDGNTTEFVIDICVDKALKDFCGVVQIPQVTDPSDLESSTGEIWNIPAMLIDSGVIGQLDQPIATLNGYINEPTAPEGLIQEFATDLHIGVMRFNTEGSKSECTVSDPHVLYSCLDDNNKDGGIVIVDIDQGDDHTTTLVSAINNMEADTWTPLAEAMYNAIGYYGQNYSFRLDHNDFTIDAGVDPVEYWCQDNHVLIITEGASTADLNVNVAVASKDYGDDGDDISACNALSAGTYLDDMTYFGRHGAVTNIYTTPTLDDKDKQNIKTHIVATGTLRDTGDSECSPDVLMTEAAANGGTTLYNSDDAAALEDNLRQVFSEIRAGASAGSAASVISSSRGGEGAIYQAIFWPSVDVADSDPVEWTGEVHALHIDSSGYLYEDTVGDRILNIDEDKRVIIYFDTDAGKSKVCNAALVDGACPAGSAKDVDEVQYLWSASDWLSKVGSVNNIFHNRTYISNERKRYIFTWIDLNNNGIVDSNEALPFEDRNDTDTATDWENMVVSGGRGAVHKDFNAENNAEVNQIVRWVRGYDDTGQRSRQLQTDLDKDGNKDDTVTWRLGDVIHSTPMVVTRPSENYDLLYRDISYAAFASQYNNRRHVIYFGANDGMIHAVNGGFYSNSEKKFCLTSDCDESDLTAALELGAELWAYVPTNLLPHLKCLTKPEYLHKYFVDLRPRIFDVRIFPEDDDHPGGWGTILVGGMRLGGAKVLAADLNGDAEDTREFTSAYFIMDITNPEKPPALLGELTRTTDGNEVDLGYTTAIPSMVVMNKGYEADDGDIDADDGNYYKWYLVFGNGPGGTDGLDGESDQKPRISILPLSWLIDPDPTDAYDPRKGFRLPAALPSSDGDWPEGGTFVLNDSGNGFVSDLITVDFYLKPDYMSDAVYFGTMERSPEMEGSQANWSGKMYRLVTRNELNNTQVVTIPSQWSSPYILLDAGQPITASATVGTDGNNFWVYFGTGRFFNSDDKTDTSQQTYYGIKEPMNCDNDFTWDTVENTDTTDADPTKHNGTPGNQGLLRVDQILVKNTPAMSEATLSCIDDVTNACLPSDVTVLSELVTHIAGSGCSDADPTGTDGWYKNFLLDRERNLGQATLLGGLTTFTTYQPYNDPCQSEGLAFLYGVYYLTGTPWHKSIFGDEGLDSSDEENVLVLDVLALGRGLATTPNLFVGKGDGGPKAFMQTSTGEIKEIPQTNLPIQNYKSGTMSWRELIP